MRARWVLLLFGPLSCGCFLAHRADDGGDLDASPGEDRGLPGDAHTGTREDGVASTDASNCEECDGMAFVPAGPFWMGCAPDDVFCFTDPGQPAEAPFHEVNLSAFHIDRTEVTRQAYAACATEGVCSPPAPCEPGREPDLREPVVCVTWYQAREYCAWRGRRLCTEAEWEKAARGEDGRLFPWGDEQASCARAVMFDCDQHQPDAVGSRPTGTSPYGALDMSGNVWEWTHDWFGERYYDESPRDDPLGPPVGVRRSTRGGFFRSPWPDVRVSFRAALLPDAVRPEAGFRCCR